MPQKSMHSPIGDLTISSESGNIVALDWGWARDQTSETLLHNAIEQLQSYFDGKIESFNLPLHPKGTIFQHTVWRSLNKILYGKTMTYGSIARNLKTAPRAVGAACKANPMPIFIPCHRVLSYDTLGGYSGEGGVQTKKALLRLEDAL